LNSTSRTPPQIHPFDYTSGALQCAIRVEFPDNFKGVEQGKINRHTAPKEPIGRIRGVVYRTAWTAMPEKRS
jgi:hypothetical protein